MYVGITQEEIKSLLVYDKDTGHFSWKNPTGNQLKGPMVGPNSVAGYRTLHLKGKNLLAHRMAFLYMTGSIPEYVDHINGIRDDNRWCNLRPATKRQNQCNQKLRSDNTSGVKGVIWIPRLRRWQGKVFEKGKPIKSKCFKDLISAELWVREEREKHYGEFFNHG